MKKSAFWVGVWALVTIVCGGPTMAAGPYRTAQEAVRVASVQMAQTRGMESASSSLELKATYNMPDSDEPALYILADQNNGLVIVSASERMPAVLGYSKGAGKVQGISTSERLAPSANVLVQGNTDARMNASAATDYADIIENMPPAMKELLEQYGYLAQALESVPGATLKDAQNIPDSKEQLIKTSWNQNEPANNYTPIYNAGGDRSTTGCIATAMAQIIYYYRYPQTGTGSIHYLTNTNDFEVDVTFGKPYDYDNMLLSYIDGYYRTIDYTPEQGDAIATLMLHCGASVNMDYGVDSEGGSSASSDYVPYALSRNFGYDKGMRCYDQKSYSGDWAELLRNELRADRPVIYGAVSPTMGGHAFLVDGFDQENRFHVNWGWGYNGYFDGWFMLTDLTVPNQNVTFSYSHMCVTGIQPDRGGSYEKKSHNKFISSRIAPMPSSTSLITEYTFNRADKVRIYVELENYTDEFFDYEAAVAIYQGPTLVTLIPRSMDDLDPIKGASNRYILNMAPMSNTWQSYAETLSLPVGNYTILPVYRPRYEGGNGEWKYIPGANGKSVCYDLIATDTQYTLTPSTSTPVETIRLKPATEKILRGGRIIISRDGREYDILGRGF